MLTIYVAHPFSNDPAGNMAKIDKIMKEITAKNPNDCFISPLHNFSFDKTSTETQILSRCFKLIGSCDELWVYGNFETSVGCRAEMAFARYLSIPIVFKE